MVAAAFWIAGGSPASAQEIDPFGWIEEIFKPKPAPQVKTPRPEIRRAPPKHSTSRPKASVKRPEKAAEKPPEKPAVAPSYFVAVLGDSLGQTLAQGLTSAFADRPDVAVLRKAKENSGLVRDDFYDWVKTTQDLLASGEKIDFAVMLVGSNDRQALRDAEGTFEPRSDKWLEVYRSRIETIATAFRDKKIPLVWVGLPVLKNERLAEDALAFNEIYREVASKNGATYVDIWERFADEHGGYRGSGPDINGQIVRLRAGDGIHFTKAGARKLAHFIEPEIRRHLDQVRPKASPEVAGLHPTEPGDGLLDPSQSEEGPHEKPIAGPVMPLTGPVLAPGGTLATGGAQPESARESSAQVLSGQHVLTGQAAEDLNPTPKPGRADDFSWPRP
jgi:hypothetical protein